MNFLTLLPMAFVMVAGPQILSAIFLATSENWQRNSAAYIFGASLSITLIVTIAYLVGGGGSGGGPSSDTLYVIVLVLLVAAAVHTYLKRKESEPPKWMGKLQTANPGFSFKLGFLLLGVFPTDILTSVAVGAYLAAHGDPWWHYLPFVALTLLFLGAAVAPPACLPGARPGLPSEGARLDEHEFLGRQRGRDPVLHRDHDLEPGGIAGPNRLSG